MSGIQGKVIAITGASGGVGALAARVLAGHGAHVVLGARRLPRLAELAARIADEGGSAQYLALDVGDRCATQRFISSAHAWFGRLDVIVNAAGATAPPRWPLELRRLEEWDRGVDVNIRGVLNTVAAGLPLLRAQGHGQIINLASIAPAALPATAVHGVTGFALRALTEGLRREAGEAIRVELITPASASAPAAVARAIARAIAQPAGLDMAGIIERARAGPRQASMAAA